jgi:hypothetical protein
MTSDLELGWLAGIIDGEGSLGVYWANKGKYTTGGNVYAEVRIEVSSFAMVSRFAAILDGLAIGYRLAGPTQKGKATNKPTYRLAVYRRGDVVSLLHWLRPALIVKAPEADAILQWYERWPEQRGNHPHRASHNEKVVFYEEVKRLKRTA